MAGPKKLVYDEANRGRGSNRAGSPKTTLSSGARMKPLKPITVRKMNFPPPKSPLAGMPGIQSGAIKSAMKSRKTGPMKTRW